MDSNRAKTSSLGFAPVLIILLLAAAVAVGLFLYTQWQPGAAPSTQPAPAPRAQRPLDLTIDSPTDGGLAVDQKLMVKGKTLPNTTVVIYTEEGDQNIIVSDPVGKFEGSIGLVEGINSFTVTAFAESGEEKTMNMDVVYNRESS